MDFARGIRSARELGVHLITAEFWHDGREDWQNRLRDARYFLQGQMDRAGDDGRLNR